MHVHFIVAQPLITLQVDCVQRLEGMTQTSQRGIAAMRDRGYTHFYVMYSGGKNSTAALVLTRETLKDTDAYLEILYCDTQLEIPTLHRFAHEFLHFLETQGGQDDHLDLLCGGIVLGASHW